ncbi:MAG: renalase [Actinomycetota bacterium]|nr:renalase [Actinomycetota bacterium]
MLDKGRTPGGRAATRRFADSRFDHGLPLLTDQGPLTRALTEEGHQAGVLEEIEADGTAAGGWFAPAGISALGKHLASGLKIRSRCRATGIEEHSGSLTVTGEPDLGQFTVEVRKSLMLTSPLPQSLELLAPLEPDWLLPEEAPCDKCVVAMARIDQDRLPDGPLLRDLEEGSGRLALEHRKFPDVIPGVSLRFSPLMSEGLFEVEDGQIKEVMSGTLEEFTGPVADDQIQLMKWRYATGSGAVPDPYFGMTRGEVAIAVCGDGFFGGAASGTRRV